MGHLVNIAEAKANLSKLVDRAAAGEEVTVIRTFGERTLIRSAAGQVFNLRKDCLELSEKEASAGESEAAS